MYKIACWATERVSWGSRPWVWTSIRRRRRRRHARHSTGWPGDGETAIIYLTEQFAEQMQDEVKKYKDMVTPAIILIPGKSGSLGIGMKNITDSVERAVGADIL